ncbi:MAG: hypothetical protein IPI13_12995 [Actinomycetales bacterium]|uniref:Putative endonuclease Z1 domain-containing protein n=1 Tax=Candidatus Phosphoribacter hodrii TaxID=2953743 RepID=A0A935IMS5_9MICO|nr:hypothetical protein [Candidatus Phosphoribacter hodrii]
MIDAANPGNLKAPRSSTYPEPAGLPTFYTGGEVFYRRGVPARLCRPLGPGPGDDRADAVRAFLVAGAIRLLRSGRVGPATATAMAFGSAREAERTVTAPHSMLYHPSASIQDHFTSAEDLLMWAGVPDRQAARQLLASGNATLPDALAKAVVTHPAPWAAWLDRYQASARVIETEFNVVHPSTFPDWPTLQILLTEEIIPGTRVSVVNSDPAADDRPSYRAVLDPASGSWRAPRDLCTIFVSGNVMARGLTLEGMTTALFQRSSNAPLADTQMQMQRWFGYRGSYIELCRVFASADQLALFSAYHDIDEAIRSAIIERMTGGAPEPAVLQGTDFIATGKIANIGNYPLSPGGRSFVRLVNDGASPDSNLAVVADLFGSRPSTAVAEGSRQLGRILTEPLTLLEAADWLDKFRYADYAPGDQGDLAKHWAQVETRLSAEAPLAEPGLYRPPVRGAAGDPARRISPYSIAAYLRLWAACLERPVRGLFVTGEPGRLWSMSDLQAKLVSQPRFWVGIRFGKGHVIQLGDPAFDVMTTVKTIADGELTTDWGTSTPTAGPGQYRADIYFDYYHRNEPTPVAPGDSTWRPAGPPLPWGVPPGRRTRAVRRHPSDRDPALRVETHHDYLRTAPRTHRHHPQRHRGAGSLHPVADLRRGRRRRPRPPRPRRAVPRRSRSAPQDQDAEIGHPAPLLAPHRRRGFAGQQVALPAFRPLRPDRCPDRHRAVARTGGPRSSPGVCRHGAHPRARHQAAGTLRGSPPRAGGRTPPAGSPCASHRRRIRRPTRRRLGRVAAFGARPHLGRHRRRGQDHDAPHVQPHCAGHRPGGTRAG